MRTFHLKIHHACGWDDAGVYASFDAALAAAKERCGEFIGLDMCPEIVPLLTTEEKQLLLDACA